LREEEEEEEEEEDSFVFNDTIEGPRALTLCKSHARNSVSLVQVRDVSV
jgi:hypothetical protein